MTTETRSNWAPVALTTLFLLAAGMLVLFVDRYFGGDGVRLVAVVFGIMVLILFTVGLGFGVMWLASRLAMRHHDNVLQGIVDFQNADDRGEVARTVASGISGAIRSGTQLDRSVLQLAGSMARQQANAIVAARQPAAQPQAAVGGPTWAMHPGADVDADFNIVQ